MKQRLKHPNTNKNNGLKQGSIKQVFAREIVKTMREDLKGRVIAPDDMDYDQARTPFVGGIDRRPIAIARAANVDNVAYIISFACASGLELAVRSGGHSSAGHSISEGGIVSISKQYADKLGNDDKAPYNTYYERPAMLSQLLPLAGLRVLDAGCDTGNLAESIARKNAAVTAFDYNPDFVLACVALS